MNNKKNSQTIKVAFILAIIGGSAFEIMATIYLLFAFLGRLPSLNFSGLTIIYAFFLLAFLAAPLIFGIISYSLIKNIQPTNPKDRILRLLTKIFSIVNIVGGAILLGYVLIVVWIIAWLVAIFTSTVLIVL